MRSAQGSCTAGSFASADDNMHAVAQSFVGYVSLINKSAFKATEIGVKVRLWKPVQARACVQQAYAHWTNFGCVNRCSHQALHVVHAQHLSMMKS